jgi:hypothetical protein
MTIIQETVQEIVVRNTRRPRPAAAAARLGGSRCTWICHLKPSSLIDLEKNSSLAGARPPWEHLDGS